MPRPLTLMVTRFPSLSLASLTHSASLISGLMLTRLRGRNFSSNVLTPMSSMTTISFPIFREVTHWLLYYSFCSILRPKGVLLLPHIMTKRSTPYTQKGVAKLTKINIYYSFCSILRQKGVLLLLNIMTKRSTPFAQYYDQKEYSFYPERSCQTDKNEYLLLLLLYFETKGSTPFAQYYDQKEYSFYPERSCQK